MQCIKCQVGVNIKKPLTNSNKKRRATLWQEKQW
nr:MAG TPA: hypothetical protein [Caudoviricetes sp.]